MVSFPNTIKYICKVIFAPKKSTSKVNGFSNNHILNSLLVACFHIIMPSKRTKYILRQPNFQNFPGTLAIALKVIAWMDTPKYGETLRDTYSPRGWCFWRTFGPSRYLLDRTLQQKILPTGLLMTFLCHWKQCDTKCGVWNQMNSKCDDHILIWFLCQHTSSKRPLMIDSAVCVLFLSDLEPLSDFLSSRMCVWNCLVPDQQRSSFLGATVQHSNVTGFCIS